MTILKDPTTIIPFIDLTSLNADDNEESIIHLCRKTELGTVAAVCVSPQFIRLAIDTINNPSIKIATVINFPHGDSTILETLHDIEKALTLGANEIDMVFPYRTYLRGETKKALDFVIEAKKLCQKNITLKIIIETGELTSLELIKAISVELILAGTDFIKTSTGKTKQGATIEAATAILTAIKEQAHTNTHSTGIKISGGIRTITEAHAYIQLAYEIMGNNWVNPNVFRIGASKLFDEIILFSKLLSHI